MLFKVSVDKVNYEGVNVEIEVSDEFLRAALKTEMAQKLFKFFDNDKNGTIKEIKKY
jgi:Ca2+-binding EF-hand superfamily protein